MTQQINISKVSVRSKGYNPDQPRVPAGQEGGGQWTSGAGGGRNAQTGQTRVYHGTTYYKLSNLLSGESTRFPGLSVTDTPERAQLYADAQASKVVSDKVRRVPGSAVVEMTTNESIKWTRRPDDHPTLDKAEATIGAWNIEKVTVYIDEYTYSRGVMRVDGQIVNAVEYLKGQLGKRIKFVKVAR